MPPTKKRELELEQRRKVVAANILAGLNYRDIAAGLGVSLGTISRDANIVLDRMRKEQVATASEAALLDLRRLDVALNAIWDEVKAGKSAAIDRLLRILERRAKMLGYDEEVFNVAIAGVIDIEDVRQKRWDKIADKLEEALDDEETDSLDPNEDTDDPANE